MRLFLDCEYNDFKGKLISMALVSEDGREWYQSVGCQSPSTWVAANVMPVIGISPVTKDYMRRSLGEFLAEFPSVHIIADWPEDIAHFCESLICGPGWRIDTPPLTMEVVRIDAGSVTPHNALSDARGIRDWILGA